MSSHKFALVLLSTTVFGLLPGLSTAAAESVTLNDEAIKTAQESSNNTFEVSDNKDVDITSGTTLSSGKLKVTAKQGSEKSVFRGTLGANGSNGSVPTLTVEWVGNADKDTTDPDHPSKLAWKTWTDENTTGWTNLAESSGTATQAAIMSQNAVLNISQSVFAGSNNTNTGENANYGGAVFVGSGAQLSSESNIYFNNKTSLNGGAVFVHAQSSGNTFSNNYFVKNHAEKTGGALDIAGNVANIDATVFGANTSNEGGGAVIVREGGSIDSMSNSLFEENTTQDSGGAIYVVGGGAIDSITKTIFKGNTATNDGGAIYNKGTIGSITDSSLFDSNKATSGGAIFMRENSSANVSNSTFTGNTATANPEIAETGFGGAIGMLEGSTLNTEGNTFTNNQLLGENSVAGGAVHNDNGTWTSVNDTFTGNSSATDGGAIGSNGNTTLTNATITGNTATARGGGVVARNSNGPAQMNIINGKISNNTAAVGGGLANVNLGSEYANTSNVTVNGTEISGNQAIENGSNAQSGHGGGIYNEQILTVSNATVSNNTAVSGAGIYNYQDGTATIEGTTTISGNTASGNGGGVYNNGQLTVNGSGTGVTVSGNNAVDGAGIYNYQDGTATIEGTTTISGNTATGNGGGVYNAGNLTIKGSNVTIKGNNAALGQNLYNAANAIVNIENASDEIDLNYVPYPDTTTPRPSGELHTLFDQTQDIYNAGTMNITDSNLQLHQGINTSAALTDDAQRKVGTVNITGSTVDLGGSDVDGAGVMYGDQVNINANSTIKTHVNKEPDGNHGKISANDINVAQDNTTLDVVISSGTLEKGEKKQYQVLNGNITGDFTDFGKHANYGTRALGNGNYEVYRKGENACPGCDENEVNTNNGWLDGDDITQNSDAYDIQQKLFEAGDGQREALDGLAPDVSPLVQAHATEITQRLASIVSDRFYESMERTGYIHRGKRFYRFPRHDSNLWVQGLYGKSKYDVRKGWDMDNRGISVGFDGHVNDAVRLGIAYAYTNSSGESVQRDTDIKSHTGMIYGNYNPNRFYANWLAMYTRSKYDEDKKVFNHNVKASYDVDAFGAQLMLGRKMGPYVSGDWATGVIKPEIGARYIYTKQHAYTDTVGQSVGSADGNTLTGILGAQYTIGYALSPTLSWYPELRAALTYDFVEPDTKMRVNLLNGSVYEVKTENMDRFGIEVGARIGLDINRKAEVAIEYEGLFKGDYTNHTGLANLKYKF